MGDTSTDQNRRLLFVGCGYLNECPREWGQLSRLTLEKERHCDTCDRTVYRCDSEKEFQEHARAEHCVAFHSSIFPNRGLASERTYFGGPILGYETGSTLNWD